MQLLLCFLSMLAFFSPKTSFDEFTDQNYDGGTKAFLRYFYERINYPKEARSKMRIGQLKSRLVLASNGSIVELQFLNRVGAGIENEVRRVIQESDGNWLVSDAERSIEFQVAFQITDGPEIKGDIVVTAYSIGVSNRAPEKNTTLIKRLKKAQNKDKIEKVKSICEELLRRAPDDENFLEWCGRASNMDTEY